MDWLEFLRTEPKVSSNSNLMQWQDFLRQESPGSLWRKGNLIYIDEFSRLIHWSEFLRTSEPHETNNKVLRNNQLQIESLRTPVTTYSHFPK